MRSSGNFVPRLSMALPSLCVTNKCSQMKLEVNGDESEEEEELSNRSLLLPIVSTLSSLKRKVQINRGNDVKEKMEKNSSKLLRYTTCLNDSANLWDDKSLPQEDKVTFRSQKVLCSLTTGDSGTDGKEECLNPAAPIISGNIAGVKTAVRPTKLAAQQNVPPYTTWIYLDRNQRMTEDQSVQGRRRIYYDPVGNETLIASDSEEEEVDDEEPKHEFSKGEDFIIWTAVLEQGASDLLFEKIAESINVKCEEVQARYELLLNDTDKQANCEAHAEGIRPKVSFPVARRKGTRDLGRLSFKESHSGQHGDLYIKTSRNALDLKSEDGKIEAKDLVAAMDSFDNLFCRRCLVFDCRLHGCSQPLVHPSERQSSGTPDSESVVPCGPQCYLLIARDATSNSHVSEVSKLQITDQMSALAESTDSGREPKRQKTQEGESDWSGENPEPDKVVGTSTTKDTDMISAETLSAPLVIDSNESVQLRKKEQASVASRLTSHKKLARSSSRRLIEPFGERFDKSPAQEDIIDLTGTDAVSSLPKSRIDVQKNPEMEGVLSLQKPRIEVSKKPGTEAVFSLQKSRTEVSKFPQAEVIDLTGADGDSSKEDSSSATYKPKGGKEVGDITQQLEILDVSKEVSSVPDRKYKEERTGITSTKKLARSGKRAFIERSFPPAELKQSEGQGDPLAFFKEQVVVKPKDARIGPLVNHFPLTVEKTTPGKVLSAVNTTASGGILIGVDQMKVDLLEKRSKGTSPKKLARSAKRPGSAKLDVICELQSPEKHGDFPALTQEAEQPAKEEKSRNTAARKLARSARKVFAEKVAVAIQHQQLQTQIDLNKGRKEVGKEDRLHGGGSHEYISATSGNVSPLKGGFLSQSSLPKFDTGLINANEVRKEQVKQDIPINGESPSQIALLKHNTVRHTIGGVRMDQGKDLILNKVGSLSTAMIAKFDPMSRNNNQGRKEQAKEGRIGGHGSREYISDTASACSPFKRGNLSQAHLTKYVVHGVDRNEPLLRKRHMVDNFHEDSDVDPVKHPALEGLMEIIRPAEGTIPKIDNALKLDEFNENWSALEKGLCEKGLQIFGRSSCKIAKTMLKGYKTCAEVGEYIVAQETAIHGSEDGMHLFPNNMPCVLNWDVARARARFLGRRKGSRKLKFTLKSAGQSAIRKRMVNGKDAPCRQYTPCGCLFTCGKQCPCQLSGTCCEKYCGCAKSCKNRFRGCHCAKSQCCSRQCPCFAAGRECDPDVCRNCWIGCGDGKLTGLPQRDDKDNYQCHNMKLLLKQQQRVLLSRSDVAGWGAFLKSSVGKHEYLGEYTGELISHREADKRGKIYDRENSSFLFNLNDQCVLDACRKGDKLKFANHSPNPNCYAKVIMVAGDHRVGIFAKERIMAGEELFYDYRYEAERAPAWARKGEDSSNGKKDDAGTSERRSKQAS